MGCLSDDSGRFWRFRVLGNILQDWDVLLSLGGSKYVYSLVK